MHPDTKLGGKHPSQIPIRLQVHESLSALDVRTFKHGALGKVPERCEALAVANKVCV